MVVRGLFYEIDLQVQGDKQLKRKLQTMSLWELNKDNRKPARFHHKI